MSLKREEPRTLALALPTIGEDAKMQRALGGTTGGAASTQPHSPSPRAVLARAPSPSSSVASSSSSSLLVTTLVPTTDSTANSDCTSRKMSFTASPKPEPAKKSPKKKKHRPRHQKRPKTRGYSPSQWRRRQLPPRQHRERNEDEDGEVAPIRRRFHSSDIVLRSSPAVNALHPLSSSSSGHPGRLDASTLALRRWVAARAFDGRQTRAVFGNRDQSQDPSASGEEEENSYEPEPPLADPADEDFERLDQRRRTCSENFTKSSHAPAEFFPKSLQCDGGDADDSDEYTDEELVVPEDEEHKSEDGEMEMRGEDEEESVCGLGERQPSGYDGSWASVSSSVYQYGVSASAVGYTPGSSFASHMSVESDGQNLEKLRNLQKLYQEGFITVTEYKDRRVQLVDELSEAEQTIAKTTDLLSHELPIIYREPPDFALLRERDAIKHVFDSEERKWTSSRIKVKIDTEPFAKGGLRQVFHLQDLSVPPRTFVGSEHGSSADEEDINESSNSESVMGRCTSYVAKIAIDPNENPDTYFRDVEMQAVAAKYAKLYNSYNPPRRVEFLEAWILQLVPDGVGNGGDDEQREENLTLCGTICGVEPFIAGEYHKHNNNFGYVSELERNTPQAFSHFSYEASGQQILVVDIQGVGDHYTDPQIHTRRGKEFGKGNLAVRGFERFLGSHRCNPICRYLKLPLINPKDEEPGPSGAAVDPKGTIPAQTYMSQPHVLVDQVDSVLCHYYGDSKAFKRYHAKKKRQKKKREKQQQRQWQEQHEEGSSSSGCGSAVGVEQTHAMQQAGNKFAAVLLEQQRSCTSFVCGGVPACSVS